LGLDDFFNSRMLWPIAFPMPGSFFGPKITSTITRMITSSGHPKEGMNAGIDRPSIIGDTADHNPFKTHLYVTQIIALIAR